MVDTPFFATFDLASLSIWMFYVFFAALIIYIQRENMREGYPMTNDDGEVAPNQGPYPVPSDKTFLLPHGAGELTVPSGQRPDRQELALERTSGSDGFPFRPTGDPMADGVGPASWANRADVPEVDGHNKPKIVPLSHAEQFFVAAGYDPRGLTVQAGDKLAAGKVTDMWIDEPEQMVRYLEIELASGGGQRLVPLTLARVKSDRVVIRSLFAAQFDGIPQTASMSQITKLEEDKICGYVAGGQMYASAARQDPQL